MVNYEKTKPHCNVGTIGHVDHGKTTLTAAITRVLFIDRLMNDYKGYELIDKSPEERERGITIIATHIEYITSKRHYSHIDCPGHQNYIKNMITGAVQMDGAILVIASTEGIKVQTREHVILAQEIGIPYIIVYLNKTDMLKDVGKTLKEFIELEIREFLESYGFPGFDLPCVWGSAREALEEMKPSERGYGSVKKLINFIDDYIEQPLRDMEKDFLMPIEDVFLMKNKGTVVTGRIEQGIAKVKEEFDIIGLANNIYKKPCWGIEMFQKSMTQGEAGDNVGILLKNMGKRKPKRGQVICKLETMEEYQFFRCRVYFLKSEEGGRKRPMNIGYKPQFFIRTADITGTIKTFFDESGDESLSIALPGDSLDCFIVLQKPVCLHYNLRFTMREGRYTIGHGLVTEFKKEDLSAYEKYIPSWTGLSK